MLCDSYAASAANWQVRNKLCLQRFAGLGIIQANALEK